MRRRKFITLLGGAATWPLAARAQQTERIRRIGVLGSGAAADDPEQQANIAVFLQVLQQLGWADGRNAQIEYRFGAGNPGNVHKYTAELAALVPDVIFAAGTASVGQMLQATRTVPIVFVYVADPVGAGFASYPPASAEA